MQERVCVCVTLSLDMTVVGWRRNIVLVLVVLAAVAALSVGEYEDDAEVTEWSERSGRLSPKWQHLIKGKHPSKMNGGPGCRRACTENGPPLVCRYHFVLEYYHTMGLACGDCPQNNSACYERMCVTGDGVARGIMTINRRMPGPSIQVCQGDTVVVDLENRIPGASTAIHWHGVLQRGSPYMDGVPMLTQCPIPEGTTFRYTFTADEIGTYFWHSHDGLQKMDGVTGSLVVRSPSDPSALHYDWDMQQHVMVVQDWLHQYTAERMPGPRRFRRGQRPDTLLINGRGKFIDPVTRQSNGVPMAEFRVHPGFRYRFRIVHAGCLVCPLQLSVQQHRMTLIATDASPVRPVTFDSLIILPGERYDVVIHADQPVAAYWIHLKALGECVETEIYQEAVLRYDGTGRYFASASPGYEGFPTGVVMNPLDAACGAGQSGVCISQLRTEVPPLQPNPLLTSDDVVRITLGFDFKMFTFNEQFRSKQFYKFYEPATPANMEPMVAGRMNEISLALPPSPVLSQPDVWRDLCNSGSPRCCSNPAPGAAHRECFHVISVPLGANVELLLLDNLFTNRSLTHPIHLHGFMFAVTEMGTRESRKNDLLLETRAATPLQNLSPAMKDTVAVPSGGFVRVRFVAKNPGYWLIHCHVLFHLDSGMAAVIRVGEESDLPPVPENFPTCGDYKPSYRH